MIKTRLFAFTAGLVLMLGTAAIAQKPEKNISHMKHPNLAAAQKHCQMAWDAVGKAQSANEFDMGGHAQKAKDLLEQANTELKAAAEAANANQKM
jgi:hypothetical protein